MKKIYVEFLPPKKILAVTLVVSVLEIKGISKHRFYLAITITVDSKEYNKIVMRVNVLLP